MVQNVQVSSTVASKPVLKQHKIWQEGHEPEPCAVVIFGATGDLTQRKLLPTLAHLWHDHPLTLEQWREMALKSINTYMPEEDRLGEAAQKEFAQCLFYCQSNFDDREGYEKLA